MRRQRRKTTNIRRFWAAIIFDGFPVVCSSFIMLSRFKVKGFIFVQQKHTFFHFLDVNNQTKVNVELFENFMVLWLGRAFQKGSGCVCHQACLLSQAVCVDYVLSVIPNVSWEMRDGHRSLSSYHLPTLKLLQWLLAHDWKLQELWKELSQVTQTLSGETTDRQNAEEYLQSSVFTSHTQRLLVVFTDFLQQCLVAFWAVHGNCSHNSSLFQN